MAIDPTKAVEPIPMAVGSTLFVTRPPAGRRSKVGLDVLLTKAAVDFQNPPATGADDMVQLPNGPYVNVVAAAGETATAVPAMCGAVLKFNSHCPPAATPVATGVASHDVPLLIQ